MTMSYKEAKNEMGKGLLLACPHEGCLMPLEFDSENKTGSCEKHGVIVGSLT